YLSDVYLRVPAHLFFFSFSDDHRNRHSFPTRRSSALLLSCFGPFHGHEGVRQAAILLEEYLPNARYNYEECIREGELCVLGWSRSEERRVGKECGTGGLVDDWVIMKVGGECGVIREY